MLAEECDILDPDSALWQQVRPLLNIVLSMEAQPDLVWHGWNKQQITAFLSRLPAHCALIVGVWATNEDDREVLRLGFVCEVRNTEVFTLRTFESLVDEDIPSPQELEPGAEHALAIMRYVRSHVAPVAWALFMDEATWRDWIYTDTTDDKHNDVLDKGAILMTLARQGRCVLMGSQVRHHEY